MRVIKYIALGGAFLFIVAIMLTSCSLPPYNPRYALSSDYATSDDYLWRTVQ